ncbi:MAG: hypothetical protein AB7F65_06555 [Dehalococcoidia bacterium]
MTDKKPKPDQEPDTRSPFERFLDLAQRVVTVPKERADEKRKSA